VFKGLGNLANMASMIKQAQEMGGKLKQLSEELKLRRAQGTSGGGMVTVETNGLGEVLRCRIDPSLAADRELLEDLLPAARAARRSDEVTGGWIRCARAGRHAGATFRG